MVRVSDVSVQRGRVKIVLDDGSSYLLLKSMFLERPLQVNEEVDEREFADWVTLRQYRSALEKAVTMLAARACSQGEIRQKLRRIGYAPDTIDMVLYKLEKEGFLNDQEFARQWTQYRSGLKMGPRRIAQELRAKGVDSDQVEAALTDLQEEDQMESALSLARKALRRAHAGEDPRKTRQRAMQTILRRGYSWDQARQACDQVLREEEF